jgi:hypothetical protein
MKATLKWKDLGNLKGSKLKVILLKWKDLRNLKGKNPKLIIKWKDLRNLSNLRWSE